MKKSAAAVWAWAAVAGLGAAGATFEVAWKDWPLAKALAEEVAAAGEEAPELKAVNSCAFGRCRSDGFVCAAGPTPKGYEDVRLAWGGSFPYVTKGGETNRADLGWVAETVLAKQRSPLPDTVAPLRVVREGGGRVRYEEYGKTGGSRDGFLGFQQFGGIWAEGAFERTGGMVARARTKEGAAAARRMAAAANRLGAEGLVKYGLYPVEEKYPRKEAPGRKFVYAHAMQCFLLGGIPEGFAHSYGSGAKTEDFAAWPPEAAPGCRTWWSERLAGLVHKPTLEAARADLDCAEAAGLDAMGVLIYPGVLSADNPWHGGVMRTCEAAQGHRVKILFDLWGTFGRGWSREAKARFGAEHGRMLRGVFERFPRAWMRVNGKICLQFGRDMVQVGGAFGNRAEDYGEFWEALGGRGKYYVICTQTDTRAHNKHAGWEGFGDMSTFWCVHCGWGDKALDCVLDPIRRERGDRLAWGVSRGYYRANFGARADGGNVTEGFGACRFTDNWREAIARDCGAVYVQSWNDMGEDHHILESNFLGDSFISLGRYFADWFKSGREPEVREERVWMFHRRHLLKAKLGKNPGRGATHPSWSSAPMADYVHVVAALRERADLELRLGGETLRLEGVGPGLREWLVVVPERKDHRGNMPFWNAGSYGRTLPYDTEYRKVTAVEGIRACVPEARVVRGGRCARRVVSRTGLAGEFKFETLNVVGSVSGE